MVYCAAFLMAAVCFFFFFLKGIRESVKNIDSPVTEVMARVICKDMEVFFNQQPNAGDMSGAHGFISFSHTVRYAVFKTEGGDEFRLNLTDEQYDAIEENQLGLLKFKGTKFIDFI